MENAREDQQRPCRGVALGSDASAAGNGSVAIGKNAVTGTRFATESLGGGASLTTAHNIAGDGAVAVGDSSQAGTEGSVAIGRKATAGYYGAMLNHTTKEKKSYGIAIGDGAKAIGNYNRYSGNDNRDDAGLAVGRQAYAAGNGTIAMGYKAHAANTQNIIIGSNASTKALFKNDGKETVHPICSVGIGSDVVVKGRYSVALGPGASVGNGKLNLPESTTFMDFGGVALGYKSQVDRPGSVGLGSWTSPWRQVDSKHPIVDPEHPEQPIDEQTKYADGKKVVAPFSGQKLYFKDDIGGAQVYHTMGSNSVVNGVVSVGGVYEGWGGIKIPFLRQIINVADGTEDTDAVNLRQLKAVAEMADNAGAAASADMYFHTNSGAAINPVATNKGSMTAAAGAGGANSLAAGVSATTTKGAEKAVAIGYGSSSDGAGSIALGDTAKVESNGYSLTSIAVGKKAYVLNGTGRQEYEFSFDKSNWTVGGSWFKPTYAPHDTSRIAGGIAMGTNSYARTGSIQIGSHTLMGKMGGIDVTSTTNGEANLVNMTTIGSNSYNKGVFGTMVGAYSIATGDFTGAGGLNSLNYGSQNFGANVVGSLNSVRSKGYSGSSGVANSIVGIANMAENANGALIFGAGNNITNSVVSLSAPSSVNTVDEMTEKLRKMVQEKEGGAVLAIGGGNTADYAQASQLMGVNNTLTGTSDSISRYNLLDGYKNTGENVSHVTVIGSENSVKNGKSNVIIGDRRTMDGRSNNVVMGSADSVMETTVSDAVLIGHNANSNYDNAVVLGSNSTAAVEATAETEAVVNDIAYSGFKGIVTDPGMQVSVGAAGKERQIKHVGAGEISVDSTDAINGSQLFAVASKMQEAATAAKTTVEAGDNVTVTQGPNSNSYTISAKDTTLKEGNSALKLSGKTLSMEIEDTSGKKVTGSVDLAAIAGEVDTNTTYTMTGTENTDNTTTISLEGSDGKKQSVTVATKDTRNTVKAGTNVTVDEAANADGSSTYTVNVKADGKVEAGNTGIVNGGTVYNETRVTKDGNYVKKDNTAGQNLSALDGQVKQNADNINNLGNTINNMGNQISKLDGRVNKVGAGAAALAAMHPLDFDPDDKWNVSAGYGSYKGSHAGAIGAFYRPDENTMFNIGASVGGGENMVNAGVTFALDRKSHITTSRTAMAREIMDLRKEITELKAARANGNWMLDPEMTKLFPDVPENHWAYEYIAKLAGNGIIKGYPDGSFAGNRMMTRYEFAALLYRAMENGANVDARALKEFAPEMGRIRVDRVYGKDNDRNKIERVRVNNENTQERDTYGSKIQIAAK